MIEIIPAVLAKNVRELEESLERLKGVAPWAQIDLVGHNILEGRDELPLWDEFDFEADIMLEDSLEAAEACLTAGFARIIVHARYSSAREALEALQPQREGDFPVEVGLALRAHDEPQVLDAFAGLYDYVQVMGIDTEGSQGHPPDPHHKELGLIRALRATYPQLVIQVDGAVAAHPKELADAGADRLIIGSAIVNAEDPKASYKELYTLVNAH
jgi:pentose-5-phosphate-3-epimerase